MRNTAKRFISIALTGILALSQPFSSFAIESDVNIEDSGEISQEVLEDKLNSSRSGDVSKINNPRTVDGVSTWDCIWFGSYWQEDTNGDGYCFSQNVTVTRDGNSYKDQVGNILNDFSGDEKTYFADDKLPIKWRILNIDSDGNALLLSDKLLEIYSYHKDQTVTKWDKSTLRSYLNGYSASSNMCKVDYSSNNFLNNSFSKEEKEAIIYTKVISEDNTIVSNEDGENTYDKIFCLSLNDVRKPEYGFIINEFNNSNRTKTGADPARSAIVTNYAKSKPGNNSITVMNCGTWWLRSPGRYPYNSACVDQCGEADASGKQLNDNNYIRPAIKINLQSCFSLWSYAGIVCSDGTSETVVKGLKGSRISDAEVSTWDCIWFGNYWQDDTNDDGHCFSQDIFVTKKDNCFVDQNGNSLYSFSDGEEGKTYYCDEKKPIKWRILDIDDYGNALLLSDKLLDIERYNEQDIQVTWETCTLRSYLNGYGKDSNSQNIVFFDDNFIDKAFTDDEKEKILVSRLKNSNNPKFYTSGGNETSDKVFCLSLEEVTSRDNGFIKNEFTYYYTGIDDSRKAITTLFVEDNNYINRDKNERGATWWLRTIGKNNHCASGVNESGSARANEAPNFCGECIRPAIRINLLQASNFWKYAGMVNSNDVIEERPEKTIKVNGISIDYKDISILVGESKLLSATISPNNATDKEILWKSNDNDIATVNQEGLVKGEKEGKTSITAETSDGSLSDNCIITVISNDIDKYYVRFYKNGDNVTGTQMPQQSFYYNTEGSLKPCVYNREGYKYLGWNTEPDGSGEEFLDQQRVKNIADPNSILRLYAQWEPIRYIVEFDSNSGNLSLGEMPNQTLTYEKEAALIRNMYKWDGHSFVSWNTKADGTGKTYKDQSIVKNLSTGENVRLYAQWRLDKPLMVKNPQNTSEGVSTWDCVWFGNYWQYTDSDKDGKVNQKDAKDPVKWRILDIDDNGDTLLMSDKLLDIVEYNTERDDGTTWESSTLRSFLNSYNESKNTYGTDYSATGFYLNAFDTAERDAVIETSLSNGGNPIYNTFGGRETTDMVFCLSMNEVMTSSYGFVKNEFTMPTAYKTKNVTEEDATRVTFTTKYIADKEEYTGYPEGSTQAWWLRTPGGHNGCASVVDRDGRVGGNNSYGYIVNSTNECVRPALRINLFSSENLWKYAGTVSSDGTVVEVKPNPEETIHVNDVSLPERKTIKVGETITLIPEIKPSDATNKIVTWKSLNEENATVDGSGVVKGIKVGWADIVVTTRDGGKTATCRVTVTKKGTEPDPSEEDLETDIDVDDEDLQFTMLPGEVRRLPINKTGKYVYGVSYTSSDTKAVTVKNGVVTAKNLKKGETEKKAKVTVDYCGTVKEFEITVSTLVDGKVPEDTVIQDGKKKYKIAAPKTLNLNYGTNKTASLGIPVQLRGYDKFSITCNIVSGGVCEISGRDQGTYELSKTDCNLNAAGSKASVQIRPLNAGATYVIWSMKDDKGTTQAVTKVIVKKPVDGTLSINQVETGLDLAVGESKRLIVLNTMDNTDPKDLLFSVKMKSGKGISCSKSGFVTATSSEKAEAVVTVKSGKIKKEITVRCPGRTDNIFTLKQTSVSAKKPKSGAKAKSISFKASVPKKNPPAFTLSVEGNPKGITPGDDGKISVTDAASPGCYTVIATPNDKTLGYNTASCEIIIR